MTSEVRRVTVLGFGRFGRALAELMREAGLDVKAWDDDVHVRIPEEFALASRRAVVEFAEVLVVAVPVMGLAEALDGVREFLSPNQLVIDVGSVKLGPEGEMTRALGRDIPWVATHPLFGPASLARGERPLRVVVCPNSLHADAAERASRLYERIGCEIILEDAEAHDRAMAETHAVAFFIAKGLMDMGVESRAFSPPSFQAMENTIAAVRADAGHLFFAIQHENPFAASARARLIRSLQRIDAAIAAATPSIGAGTGTSFGPVAEASLGLEAGPSLEPNASSASIDARASVADQGSSVRGRAANGSCEVSSTRATDPLEIPGLGAGAPDLLETRELIDEIDREIVALLARRAQLSRRAGRAKAEEGRAVRDTEREASVLDTRSRWGHEAGLDQRWIRELFEAILRHSRGLQRPSG